ncbi:MAG: DUF853 family protein [Pirellula sp.]|jgi:hypothetical protein|nr:DUF853 family protein [Pirellula sp.]
MISVDDYEKLGLFYLGKKFDLENRVLLDELVNYESKDLTTHALCVGMTGSGKTGLCLSLLEEAAIDNIPVICIDPKGDLGNLLLTFPDLKPSDFEPWIDADEAKRLDKYVSVVAEETANRWKKGLESWHMPIDRIRKLRDNTDITIYTPGSNLGVPLTVLKGFDAPPSSVIDDVESYREKVSSTASGVLALLGVEADPLTSREHILISTILDVAWKQSKDLSLEELIRQIQTPPISKIGVIDLESFYPAVERQKLSMTLNNLLASPAFAGWLEGQTLDIKKLFYTNEGRHKLSIISISHLNDSERMFFVTILLTELLSWMRSQPGTSSLRAIFYMDEVYGYFPPSAKPPSKTPMLTLLKQARAFGLGIVLATQNPVDLDYKGLANMGTWFLGRLQTQRDKDRVLDGLEGASLSQGGQFDRASMEKALSALGNRVFLMNNVHDDGPTIFQTRWALSYLRGPLSRTQISSLMREKREALTKTNDSGTAGVDGQVVKATNRSDTSTGRESDSRSTSPSKTNGRPILRPEIQERFIAATVLPKQDNRLIYRPSILVNGSVHYVKANPAIDVWRDIHMVFPVDGQLASDPWVDGISYMPNDWIVGKEPEDGIAFEELSAELLSDKTYKRLEKSFGDYAHRHMPYSVYFCKAIKQLSAPEMSEMDARIHFSIASREAKDRAIEDLREKYSTKFRSLQTKISAAELKLDKERQQSQSKKLEGFLNAGTSIFGALFGNKVSTRTRATKAATAVKSIGKATAASGDLARAEQTVDELVSMKEALELELETDVEAMAAQFAAENLELEPIEIPLRKSDTKIALVALAWIPWQVSQDGKATPLITFEA